MKRVVMAGQLAPLADHPTRPAEDGNWVAETEWYAGQLVIERERKRLKHFRVRYLLGYDPEPAA